MAFADKKGIGVASGFKLQAEAPIDARFTVTAKADLDELVTIHSAYKGLEVYCEEDGEYYSYNGTAWAARSESSGSKLPEGGTAGQVLKKTEDGYAWQEDENTTYGEATDKAAGLMPAAAFTRLNGIAAGAQVNTIEHVQLNGTEVAPTDKTVNLEVVVASDLANYYTKTEVDGKVSAIPKFAIAVVEALPTEGISGTTVYLVKSGDTEGNLYTEYIYVGKAWEKLGEQSVDLTDYVTKANAVSNATAKGMVITFTKADGTTFDVTLTGTTYPVFDGTANGLVPAPGENVTGLLGSDGTWAAALTDAEIDAICV